MKFIIGQRGSGTTTALLLEASKFKKDALFVCAADIGWHAHDVCEHMGIEKPTIINFRDFAEGNFDTTKNWRVFIDNVDMFIKWGLKQKCKNAWFETGSFSLQELQPYERNEGENP